MLVELFTLAQAWAAEEAAHEAPSISELLFPLLNFLLYVYLIKRFVIPAVRDFLRSRRQQVVTSIEGATQSKQKAEAMVKEYQGRLARLPQEIQAIELLFKTEGEREKTKLLEEGQRRLGKIKEDAAFLAEQEVKVARQKIREEMAERAETRAKELIQRNLSPADQSHLVADFIQNIGQVR
jgi:F-type H+-transporting ATPase subunit b